MTKIACNYRLGPTRASFRRSSWWATTGRSVAAVLRGADEQAARVNQARTAKRNTAPGTRARARLAARPFAAEPSKTRPYEPTVRVVLGTPLQPSTKSPVLADVDVCWSISRKSRQPSAIAHPLNRFTEFLKQPRGAWTRARERNPKP